VSIPDSIPVTAHHCPEGRFSDPPLWHSIPGSEVVTCNLQAEVVFIPRSNLVPTLGDRYSINTQGRGA
jgi:hypothetical protein